MSKAQKDSEDLTPVQQLLRLKRHETPGEAFVEDFVKRFQERQRGELLRRSARSLLWERLTTYWDDRAWTKWGLSGAAAVVVVTAGWWANSGASGPEGMAMAAVAGGGESAGMAAEPLKGDLVVAEITEAFPVDDLEVMGFEEGEEMEEAPLLLSRHFSGGYADEARQVRDIRNRDETVISDGLPTGYP